eukprot:m.65620 g.65620  ORF g.65620 m.65620 type:complete len:672 (+) comp23582_c0_seq3:246-2261(+)
MNSQRSMASLQSLGSVRVSEVEHSYMNEAAEEELYEDGDDFGADEDIYAEEPQHIKLQTMSKPPPVRRSSTGSKANSFKGTSNVEIVKLNKEDSESERKRKEGTIKIMVRESETAYVRYDEDKTPAKIGNTEIAVKEGLLKKRAVGKSKLGRSNWKDRFFRLTSTTLSYYVSSPNMNPDVKSKGQVPLGAIRKVREISDSLKDSSAVPTDVLNKKYVLQIIFDNYSLYIQTPGPKDLFEWKSGIESYSKIARSGQRSMGYTQAWFFGSISRVSAQEALLNSNSVVGDFLVTQSVTHPTDFSIAVKSGKKTIKSAPIAERNGVFQIRSSRKEAVSDIGKLCNAKFKTLPELIKAIVVGGSLAKNAIVLFGCDLRRPAKKSTSLPIFARVQQTTDEMAHALNTGGRIATLSATTMDRRASIGAPPIPRVQVQKPRASMKLKGNTLSTSSESSDWEISSQTARTPPRAVNVASGYVKTKEVRVNESVLYNSNPWHKPEFSRNDAEDFLAIQPPGHFIIRNSSRGANLSITLKTIDGFFNGQIEVENSVMQLKNSPMKFTNIDSFVEYYSSPGSCPLPNTKGVLPLVLFVDTDQPESLAIESMTIDTIYDDVDHDDYDPKASHWIEETTIDDEEFEGFDDSLPPPPPARPQQDRTWQDNEINGFDTDTDSSEDGY